MNYRALLRRAFPYLVIGIGGFALAYVIIFVFVLPSKILPPPRTPYIGDTATALRPIDTAVPTPTTEPPPVQATIPVPAPTAAPMIAPDLVGMLLPDARSVLNGLRVSVAAQHDTSSLNPPNTVLRQVPEAGASMPANGTLTLVVSYFPPETRTDSNPVQRGATLPRIVPSDSDSTRHP